MKTLFKNHCTTNANIFIKAFLYPGRVSHINTYGKCLIFLKKHCNTNADIYTKVLFYGEDSKKCDPREKKLGPQAGFKD